MVQIISRAQWGARYVNGVGNRPVGSLEKYGHHSVTAHLREDATFLAECAEMRRIEEIGQQRFGRGISYTFVIFPSGRIFEGASIGRIAYHSGPGRNTRGAGICWAGNYDVNRPGSKALDAVVALLQHGVKMGWWQDPALTEMHRDFSATACPGRYLYAEFDNINRRGRSGKAPSTPSRPAPSTGGKSGRVPHTEYTVSVDGDFGYYTKIALQNVLRHRGYRTHKVDGDFGYYSILSLQRFLRAQGQRGHAVDGRWGAHTTRSLQQWLRSQGYKGHAVDGKFGPYTIRSLQQALIDGKFFRR